jgi:very-short-patch-repair endonuclease
MRYREIKGLANKLRNNPTQSEKILWEILRKRKLGGYRFLRQHPLYYDHYNNNHFFFVPDFYCPGLKLIIEMDGKIHEQQLDHDKKRDCILNEKGFIILRLMNEEVNDIETLKLKILNYINVNYYDKS